MGAPRHGQGGGEGRALAPGNVVQCFCTLVSVKGWEDELFMYYVHNLSSASGSLAPDHIGLHPWTLLGDFYPQTHCLPTPGKKSCRRPCIGYHEYTTETQWDTKISQTKKEETKGIIAKQKEMIGVRTSMSTGPRVTS